MLYFFRKCGETCDRDGPGCDLATDYDAQIEAVRFAARSLQEHPEQVFSNEDFRVEVTDSDDLAIFAVVVLGITSPAGGLSRS
jgi:hypothetical protein